MKNIVALTCILLASSAAFAGGLSFELDPLLITDEATDYRSTNVKAASSGTVFAEQLEHRPLARPAEVLETVPGMVVTQHSGGGKANQYYLRGFNLDHSTDFANYFEGAPVNMVSHGHGQGYSDLNFLLPEMIDRIAYKKGPYYADSSDFASAGSANIWYASDLRQQRINATAGQDGYLRALLMGGTGNSDSSLVYSLARTQDDGPWENPDRLQRNNVFIKHTQRDSQQSQSVSLLYFDSSWNGTDQIPERLIKDGTLNRFEGLDDRAGGETHRYQLSYLLQRQLDDNKRIKANAYAVDYSLYLTSNFTYFASDEQDPSPVEGQPSSEVGDQISQVDRRYLYGGKAELEQILSKQHTLTFGADIRFDDIRDVGVGQSFDREIYQYNSRADIQQLGSGIYTSLFSQWRSDISTLLGVRHDYYRVSVLDKTDDDNADSDGRQKESDRLTSLKMSLRYGFHHDSNLFVNFGQGYHSNDARGVVNGDVPLLSASRGFELGLNSWLNDSVQVNAVLFQLDLDSELVFVGDEGVTEPNPASRRRGLELSLFYQPVDWLVVDSDFTRARARFRETQFEDGERLGDRVPDSVRNVFSLGASMDLDNGVSGGLRLRYFGPRDLNEDGSEQSSGSSTMNANIGYRWSSRFSADLEVLNLTDSKDADITYFYASRTQSEREDEVDPIEDKHSHPMRPRTLRASINYRF